jgi:hypothetical protein
MRLERKEVERRQQRRQQRVECGVLRLPLLKVTGTSPPPGHRANELRYSLA